ncbi:glycosyltransferase family 4 protein [Candidatus Kuenenbacteria bacterium]|nr:glycosyltransferase family 4 protein [Candidatus Kuenenbacteria bacterium]
MRLLMLTRKVDSRDSRAGFVSDWLLQLSQNVNRLIVICQEQGDPGALPDNVKIYSLGKEKSYSKIRQFFRAQKLFLRLVRDCDGILAHQMPIYSLLVGPWSKLFHKKLVQWYAHGAIDWRLRLAACFVDEFITSSLDGFRLVTKKPVTVVGQGINIDKFQKLTSRPSVNDDYRLISVGRISPSKDYESMIKAVFDLREQGIDNVRLAIIGAPALAAGFDYFQKLQVLVVNMRLKNQVIFTGGLAPDEIVPYLQNADLFINLSDTGSLDKAVLEAMAAGCLVLTSNVAFRSLLPRELFTAKDEPEQLVRQIRALMSLSPDRQNEFRMMLKKEVAEHHNLKDLINKIIKLY